MKYTIAIWSLSERALLVNQGGDCTGGDGRRSNVGSCHTGEEVTEVPYFYVTFDIMEKSFYMIYLDLFDNLIRYIKKTSKDH